MREIEFRAKAIDPCKWIYGSLVNIANKHYIMRRKQIVFPPEIPFIGTLEIKHEFTYELIPILEDTIGQYTGLCDKDGKEIYEGDIVKTKYIEKRDFQGIKYNSEIEFIELVVFKDQAFQLEINNDGIKMYRYLNFGKDARTYGNIELKEIEVIGSIYDNPNLLKGE